MNTEDTIVAVATPPGEGGIGVVRLSGPRSLSIARQLFRTPRGRGVRWEPRRLYYGRVVSPEHGRAVDEVMACYMAPPRSFTGEETVEIHAHGSPQALRAIVALCLAQGARPAGRGEFTLRAFLNGRLDLAQAEAVLDVVQARTPSALDLAVAQLGGALSRHLDAPTDALLGALAHMEALIDFVEEEVPPAQEEAIAGRLSTALESLRALLATADAGIILREGVRAVLAGKPNVGKSSLLNALLRVDRAIVTPIAGTTRDTVEEPVNIRDVPVYLVDTAGLTETADPVEQLGVQRSRQALAAAGLIVLVLDGSQPFDEGDCAVVASLAALPEPPRLIVALNKDDLVRVADEGAARALLAAGPPPRAVVSCSAVRLDGLTALEDAIAAVALGHDPRLALADGAALGPSTPLPPPCTPPATGTGVAIDRARHKEALAAAIAGVERTLAGLRAQNLSLDLLCIELRGALAHLGEITGRGNIGEDVLDRIFRDFCIGK
jgi:tRNA modification GTPase